MFTATAASGSRTRPRGARRSSTASATGRRSANSSPVRGHHRRDPHVLDARPQDQPLRVRRRVHRASIQEVVDTVDRINRSRHRRAAGAHPCARVPDSGPVPAAHQHAIRDTDAHPGGATAACSSACPKGKPGDDGASDEHEDLPRRGRRLPRAAVGLHGHEARDQGGAAAAADREASRARRRVLLEGIPRVRAQGDARDDRLRGQPRPGARHNLDWLLEAPCSARSSGRRPSRVAGSRRRSRWCWSRGSRSTPS